VVVVTPREDGSHAADPEVLANRLATTATVVAMSRPEASWELTNEFGGKQLSAWHGAMCIYLPGLTRASDPRPHPLILANRLADPRSSSVSRSGSPLGLCSDFETIPGAWRGGTGWPSLRASADRPASGS
jgi:hypothetical protein